MADLHSKILDARPQVQILLISCSFWENLAKSYVGVPLEGWRPHLREILDPPLLSVSHSVHGGGGGRGSLCMMPLSVLPPGRMFLLGISVFGPMFLPGGSPGQRHPGQRPRPPGRDPPSTVKSGRYASPWNTCLFSSSNIKFVFKPPEFQNVFKVKFSKNLCVN